MELGAPVYVAAEAPRVDFSPGDDAEDVDNTAKSRTRMPIFPRRNEYRHSSRHQPGRAESGVANRMTLPRSPNAADSFWEAVETGTEDLQQTIATRHLKARHVQRPVSAPLPKRRAADQFGTSSKQSYMPHLSESQDAIESHPKRLQRPRLSSTRHSSASTENQRPRSAPRASILTPRSARSDGEDKGASTLDAAEGSPSARSLAAVSPMFKPKVCNTLAEWIQMVKDHRDKHVTDYTYIAIMYRNLLNSTHLLAKPDPFHTAASCILLEMTTNLSDAAYQPLLTRLKNDLFLALYPDWPAKFASDAERERHLYEHLAIYVPSHDALMKYKMRLSKAHDWGLRAMERLQGLLGNAWNHMLKMRVFGSWRREISRRHQGNLKVSSAQNVVPAVDCRASTRDL